MDGDINEWMLARDERWNGMTDGRVKNWAAEECTDDGYGYNMRKIAAVEY